MKDETKIINLKLPEEQMEYLNKIGIEAKSKGGKHLRKSEIIRAIIKTFKDDVELDLTDCNGEEKLTEIMQQAIKQ